MSEGRVYIVGGGPGDPGLLTVRGGECLRRAEVVVYDRLIDDQLLDLAPADAEFVYVGKSARAHAMEQSEINSLLVEKAREGRAVVRLKGGDPFVLGRGGEEAEVLKESGIPFEVVPGVSSAMAAPAYAGIPVTHRQVASSFAVITGHEDPTKPASSINWEKLATGVDTLVFLMGMGHLNDICARLVECGRSAGTPVAIIRDGTTPAHRTTVGTLATIADIARKERIEPPAVIVVGEVVNLRPKLAWFENRTLFGKRVLVTRSRTQASALSALLRERGAEPIEVPAIEIQEVSRTRELDQALTELPDYDWVIFTSANGVEAVWRRLRALGLDARQLGATSIGAIGPATAEALEKIGIFADLLPETFTTQGILASIREYDIMGSRILLPRADIAPEDLVDGLLALGAEPQEVTAYVTSRPRSLEPGVREMLQDGRIQVVTFTSSSTVTNLMSLLDGDIGVLEKAQIACIGPITAATAEEHGLTADIVAKEQTIPGLVAAIEEAFQDV